MLDLRQLLNFTYAAISAAYGGDEVVDALLEPKDEQAAAEPEPVKMVARNQAWLESLRAAGVPVPKVPG